MQIKVQICRIPIAKRTSFSKSLNNLVSYHQNITSNTVFYDGMISIVQFDGDTSAELGIKQGCYRINPHWNLFLPILLKQLLR
jgi:hypothetical protein